MYEDFMLVLYWILLCGPAALGVWGLWRDRQGND